jgi:hypothetical protein
MKIVINKDKKLSSIQQEFQEVFPFLKIEFYQQAHSKGEGSPKQTMLNNELTIAESQNNSLTGTISINGQMQVAELETAFANTFGLSVQVFRKSSHVWLQTSATDDWTLAEQNQKGMELEKRNPSDNNIIDASDRHELE